MIARYSRPEMSSLWTEQARFNYLLRVELAVLEVLIEKKKVALSRTELEQIKKGAKFDVERIKEIEKHTNHDLIAFLKTLEENIGPSAKYIHKGLTSSDVLDTALALQLRDGIEILEKDLIGYLKVLKKQARKYKTLPLIGRTHGIHAEPITLGLKLLSFYSEGLRNLERLRKARDEVAYIKISGAVGSYSQLPPDVEKAVAKKLKLKIEPVSTQVIPRDRIAYLMSVLALVAGGLERLALEIRHLQRTEVSEVFEPFGKKQKGSSAMPHKRNPILCERICGLARMFRGYLIPAIENISLWHERDISHSSVERIILPDGFILLDYILNLMTKVVEGLEVNKQAIEENLWLKKGLFVSQRLMLMLIDKGLTRSQAYDLVQKPALKAYKEKLDFKELVLKDKGIKKYLCDKEINSAFDLNSYLKHIDSIFNRFF
ncbi:MAG: adenylosuccinate lyase [Candidatus Omnitrophica bacterium]|nr:adenylosuccinate lyase [Candidatus Omnitrophota bacterium]